MGHFGLISAVLGQYGHHFGHIRANLGSIAVIMAVDLGATLKLGLKKGKQALKWDFTHIIDENTFNFHTHAAADLSFWGLGFYLDFRNNK